MKTTNTTDPAIAVPRAEIEGMIAAAVAQALAARDANTAPSTVPAPVPCLTVPEGETCHARLRPQNKPAGLLYGGLCVDHISGGHHWVSGEWARVLRAIAIKLAELRNEYALIKGREPELAFEFISEDDYATLRAHDLEEEQRGEVRLTALSDEAMRREMDLAKRAVATARSHKTMPFLK